MTDEPIPLSNEGIWPAPEMIPVNYINVNGRGEHEALLKDVEKMLSLGLDPDYERIVYLKRWGSYLDGQ